jgi:hypothetical protein
MPAKKCSRKCHQTILVAGMARSYETVRYRHYKLARGAVRERMLFNRLAEGEPCSSN